MLAEGKAGVVAEDCVLGGCMQGVRPLVCRRCRHRGRDSDPANMVVEGTRLQ